MSVSLFINHHFNKSKYAVVLYSTDTNIIRQTYSDSVADATVSICGVLHCLSDTLNTKLIKQ